MSNILVNPRSIPVIVVILFSLAIAYSSSGQCTATSAVNPVRVVDSAAPGGNFSFNNPSNAILSDNIRASAAGLISLFNGQTDYLKASRFGFSIPLSAIICGIQVEVEKSATGIGHVFILESYITDLTVSLVKNGTIVGNNKATGTHWTNTDTYSSYGSNADNWGSSLVPADINSPEFGVVFAADLHGLASLIPNAQIDNIRVTVYYLDALLPVSFSSFTVSSHNKTVSLSWKSDDHPQAAFSLQRSEDGKKWETLNEISIKQDAHSNSFEAEDNHPLPGTSWYRLKILNPPGKEYYSAGKAFTIAESITIKAFPNPFSDYILLTGIKPGDIIELVDGYGRQLPLPGRTSNSNNTRLDMAYLKPGFYFVRAGSNITKIQKL